MSLEDVDAKHIAVERMRDCMTDADVTKNGISHIKNKVPNMRYLAVDNNKATSLQLIKIGSPKIISQIDFSVEQRFIPIFRFRVGFKFDPI
ncbi:hypothetical protein ASE05_31810 [Mesorhizobium sp. Root172]|nr:hypothetical protein ASE05_31810 [Mesorhizobium sp. Root172]